MVQLHIPSKGDKSRKIKLAVLIFHMPADT